MSLYQQTEILFGTWGFLLTMVITYWVGYYVGKWSFKPKQKQTKRRGKNR